MKEGILSDRVLCANEPSRSDMELWLLEQGWLIRRTLVPHFRDFEKRLGFIGVGVAVHATQDKLDPAEDEYQVFRRLSSEELKAARIDLIEHETWYLVHQIYKRVREVYDLHELMEKK